MESTNKKDSRKSRGKGTGPFLALRFRREPERMRNKTTSPFTEMPEELKYERSWWKGLSIGKILRGMLNFTLLFILGLVLIGLVAAFAYQWIYHPQELIDWSSNLILSVQQFFQTLAAQ
jgi:hypothetical protein